MDFETLKSSQSNFDKITKALESNQSPEEQSNKNKYQDDRIWKPELDKTGNGYAVIRFLPINIPINLVKLPEPSGIIFTFLTFMCSAQAFIT